MTARGGRRLALVAWLAGFAALGVFYVFGPPPPRGAALGIGFDKMLHAIVFTTAAFAGLLWAGGRRRLERAVLGGCLTVGVVLEVLQGMTPVREFSLRDVAANMASVIAAWALHRTMVAALRWRARDEGRRSR